MVAAFLQLRPGNGTEKLKPTLKEMTDWVRQTLVLQKVPSHLFWVGSGEVLDEYPVTGCGKVRKEILREVENRSKGLEDGSSNRKMKL